MAVLWPFLPVEFLSMPTPEMAKFLADAPTRKSGSKLQPYMELIVELKRRRWSYRAIQSTLAERFGVRVNHKSVQKFIQAEVRRSKKQIELPEVGGPGMKRPITQPPATAAFEATGTARFQFLKPGEVLKKGRPSEVASQPQRAPKNALF